MTLNVYGLVEARAKLGELVEHVRHTGDPAVITRSGRPAAVVVSVEWYETHRCPNEQETAAMGSLSQTATSR